MARFGHSTHPKGIRSPLPPGFHPGGQPMKSFLTIATLAVLAALALCLAASRILGKLTASLQP